MKLKLIRSFVAFALALCQLALAQTTVHIVEGLAILTTANPPAGASLRLSQPLGRKGPTIIRHFPAENPRTIRPSPNPMDPADSNYLTKDRGVGQTFTTPVGEPFRLDAITLRVGVAPLENNISRALGEAAFIQIFEVTGTPVINNNGTSGTTQVSVFYPNQPKANDYITGETYTTLMVAKGFLFPGALTEGQNNTLDFTTSSTGTLLRFDITATGGVFLQPDRKYAFLIGFENAALNRALPVNNWPYLNPGSGGASSEALQLTGPYAARHAFRREGRFEFPESNLREALENVDANDPVAYSKSSFWPVLSQRLAQQPGTWGRPDVDNYRDLAFWIEGSSTTPVEPRAPPISGIGNGAIPARHYMAERPAAVTTTSVCNRDWNSDDTDLGAVFTNGSTTPQLDSITVQSMTISGGEGVPGLPLTFDFFRVAGPLSKLVFTPLWRSSGMVPVSSAQGNSLTFYFLSQRQILEAGASYAFVIGSAVEEKTSSPTASPLVAQDINRFALGVTSSNNRSDTYENRCEAQFAGTRPGLAALPNTLNMTLGVYFAVNEDEILKMKWNYAKIFQSLAESYA